MAVVGVGHLELVGVTDVDETAPIKESGSQPSYKAKWEGTAGDWVEPEQLPLPGSSNEDSQLWGI